MDIEIPCPTGDPDPIDKYLHLAAIQEVRDEHLSGSNAQSGSDKSIKGSESASRGSDFLKVE
jgi:hypothetical protein